MFIPLKIKIMKKQALFLTAILFIIVISCQTKRFDIDKLTKEEISFCKKFKEKEGQYRFDEFNRIKHIFPESELSYDNSQPVIVVGHKEETVNMIMTRDQLEQLIGKPDFMSEYYDLGKNKEGNGTRISFYFNKQNEILGIAYSLY